MCGFLFSTLKSDKFSESLERINHRGPDHTNIIELSSATLGFKRLSIMDLSSDGHQPFSSGSKSVLCNGEIYNYKELKTLVDYDFHSGSDCEVILPILEKFGIQSMMEKLDGEFAFVIYDSKTKEIIAARDPMGIRPLFYGMKDGEIVAFASEAKALQLICDKIEAFPPGKIFLNGDFQTYKDLARDYSYHKMEIDEVCEGINTRLVQAVKTRLQSDAPVGFLLSGGLDSSLVCSIAARHSDKPIKTFGIGMSEDAIDLKYAKEVAEHIGSDHTEVIITKEDAIAAFRDVVYHLESFDITTVRASVGMYLVCKYIHENTDIKVLLTGEVSDEIFGYKYTDFAPSAEDFQLEAQKRVKELFLYDVLRADRCISAHSLEARVPFSDTEFVEFVMGINPKLKQNTYGQGKYLLRKAFESGDWLPNSILFREKAAFSDAVGHSLVDCLKAYAEELYSDEELNKRKTLYKHATPISKESLMYRDIFNEFYAKLDHLIPSFWMPNKEWENCDVQDPSARVLPNYGASGV